MQLDQTACAKLASENPVVKAGNKKTSEDLAKITRDIAELGRRLKANAEKSKQLSSETEDLLKKTVKPES